MIKLVSLMLFLVLGISTCISCSNDNATQTITTTENTIPFEIISSFDISQGYREHKALIAVMTSDIPPIPQIPEWIYVPTALEKLKAVDYSQYFAIIVFNGWRGARCDTLKIKEIQQDSTTVYVTAHFDDGASTCQTATSSQYIIVQVNKSDLTQTGELIFKLMDDKGEERASVVQNIDK